MTREEAIANVKAAFAAVPRPDLFIRGSCNCAECLEHNDTLKTHTPDSISMIELGNACWDPICFASDEAFAYYLPGLIRVAFKDPSYTDQLFFHMNCPGRMEHFDSNQARALKDALWLVIDADIHADLNLADEAIRRLERIIELSGEGTPFSEYA